MPLQTGNKQSVDWHQPLGHTLKSRMTEYTQNDENQVKPKKQLNSGPGKNPITFRTATPQA